MPNDGIKRYLVGSLPGSDPESGVTNVAMALEGEEEAVLQRILRLIKTGPAICWSVTSDSPFGHAR